MLQNITTDMHTYKDKKGIKVKNNNRQIFIVSPVHLGRLLLVMEAEWQMGNRLFFQLLRWENMKRMVIE